MHKTDNKDTLPSSPTKQTPIKHDRFKRFMRKPSQKSDRSSSKKSFDFSDYQESYIKTPVFSKDSTPNVKNSEDFLKSLASSVLTSSTDKKYFSSSRKLNSTHNNVNSNKRLQTLQAQIQLKNQQSKIISNECQRLKTLYEQEKQRRRKVEVEKKQIIKEIKEGQRELQKLKIEVKKGNKEKEYLTKQIEFLERINYDQKTRSLQSYRENYLQGELVKLKDEIKKSKSQVQQELQAEVKKIKEEKYNIQSHYKAMKVANECLIKQLNHNSESITDFILNSEEYTKLREKYIRFLEEYKQLRNQYWSLKTEVNGKNDSSLFSITVSQAQASLDIIQN